MSPFPAADAADRRRIRESLEESLIVEAAAGTGKTTALVDRLVAILESGRTTVDRVVAVTFTRKAAGELKLRLRAQLDRRRRQADDAGRNHLETAIASLEQARIGTIHSFCGELLRERPVEAGVDPAFTELTEDESPRLFEQAFRPWMQQKLDDLPPGLGRAVRRSLARPGGELSPLEQIRDAALKLLEWRDYPTPWKLRPFARTRELDRIVDEVEGLVRLKRRASNPYDALSRNLQPLEDLLAQLERASREKALDDDLREGLLLAALPLMRRFFRKGSGPFGEGVTRQQVLRARERLLESLEEFGRESDAELAALLQRELGEVVDRYEQLKRQNGRLDFVDLLIRTRDLLRQREDVRAYFQERFSHIFVDEFQDTDALQAEILLLLSSGDARQKDWRKVTPMAGKLFLVGDPKQSIYRFRRADVVLYQQIREQLLASGVGEVVLTQSFRSVRPIQQLVNAAFEPEMSGDSEGGQARYVPLDGHRPAFEEQPSVVVLPVPRPYGLRNITKSAIGASLPEAVGAFVDWLLHQSGWTVGDPESPEDRIPVAPRHICILFRRFVSWRSDVTRPYTRALESRRIAHVLVGSRSFHHREEVESVRTALTAIEWPDDELSVYATLRGGLFGISDALLFQFRNEFGSLRPFRSVDVAPHLEPIPEALRLLAGLHRRRNRRPVVDTLNALLEATRSHAAFALRPAGHQVLANVDRMCDLARSFELAQGTSFRAFVDYLREKARRPTAAESPVLEEGIDGVRLLTVHGAKGLEFPVVILADPTCNLAARRADRHVDADRDLAAFSLLGCAPWDLLEQQQIEQRRDRAEGTRIAYVAVTRTRDLLVVPAVGDGPQQGWLQALNRAIYPSRGNCRNARVGPGCPGFGLSSVVDRSSHFDGSADFSVQPGLHLPEEGEHKVVWWDPNCLELDVEPDFGLHQERLLSDADPEAARRSLQQYGDWIGRREATVSKGSTPQSEIVTVGELAAQRAPEAARKIEIRAVSSKDRAVSGKRFGSLVHSLLERLPLDASPATIVRLAQLHGRLLDADPQETAAAVEAVAAALADPLVREAATADRTYRELPLLVPLGESLLLEGTIDLAFRRANGWVVVDYKTDVTKQVRQDYVRQVQWYVFAIEKMTGEKADGVLLGV